MGLLETNMKMNNGHCFFANTRFGRTKREQRHSQKSDKWCMTVLEDLFEALGR